MKKLYLKSFFPAICLVVFFSFAHKNDNNNTPLHKLLSFSQMEISSVKIGGQEWMTENLNVSTFRNGDTIPQAQTAEEWKSSGESQKPAWSYYDFDPNNGTIYGKLYNWYAVNDPRGLAPSGWHIPKDEEWMVLLDFLGGDNVAGMSLKSTDLWAVFEKNNITATNESGFSGLPGGLLNGDGSCFTIEKLGYWWSSSESNPSFYGGNTPYAWSYILNYYSGRVYRYDYLKSTGLSVRCVRDK